MRERLLVVRRAARLIYEAAPGEARTLLLLTLVYGAGPSVLLLLGRNVIDGVVSELTGGPARDGMAVILDNRPLLTSIVVFIVLTCVFNSIQTLFGLALDNARDRVRILASDRILAKVAGTQYVSVFEDPSLLNLLLLARRGVEQLWRLTHFLGSLLTGVFVFVPAVILLGRFSWWMPVALSLMSLPSIVVQARVEERSWNVEETQAEDIRRAAVNEDILTRPSFGAELRVFGIAPAVLGRWRTVQRGMLGRMIDVRRSGARKVAASSLLTGLGVGIPYVYLVANAIEGRFTLGDLALYAGLVLEVRRFVSALLFQGSDVYRASLGVAPLFRFLDADLDAGAPAPLPAVRGKGLRVENLSFTYPGATVPALDGVTLDVPPGRTVAIVGANGSGKTTLAKLLCRLYEPSGGVIRWNGEDVSGLDHAEWRGRLGVVMQDPARFPMSLRESVLLGGAGDDDQVAAALAKVGLGDRVEAMSAGLDTHLGRQFEGGAELSGGQWQRLALARAMFREGGAELVVLDEPTSALDPTTEHEVYGALLSLMSGRCGIVISHRLGLARFVDEVVVFDAGRIVERGHHDELMAARGTYWDMFTRQASSYVDPPASRRRAPHRAVRDQSPGLVRKRSRTGD